MKSLVTVTLLLVVFLFKTSSADLKDDLISAANLILSRAEAEVKVLQSQNRTSEVTLIQGLEKNVRDLIVKVNAAKNDTELTPLVQELGEAEGALLIALERLGVPIDQNELKRSLIIYGEELILIANQQVAKLLAENRTSTAQIIQAEERQITQIVDRLRNATLTIDIFNLEQALASAEIRLQEELLRVGYAWDTASIRNLLISRAETLQNRTNTMIARLRGDGRGEEIVAGLVEEEQRIATLVGQLKNTTNETVIAALEFALEQAEFRLELELSILGESVVSGAERQALIRQIEELVSRILIEGRKLAAANRTIEAEGLFAEQQLLVQLDVQVRNVVQPLDFLYLENRFLQIEIRVVNQLRMLGA